MQGLGSLHFRQARRGQWSADTRALSLREKHAVPPTMRVKGGGGTRRRQGAERLVPLCRRRAASIGAAAKAAREGKKKEDLTGLDALADCWWWPQKKDRWREAPRINAQSSFRPRLSLTRVDVQLVQAAQSGPAALTAAARGVTTTKRGRGNAEDLDYSVIVPGAAGSPPGFGSKASQWLLHACASFRVGLRLTEWTSCGSVQ